MGKAAAGRGAWGVLTVIAILASSPVVADPSAPSNSLEVAGTMVVAPGPGVPPEGLMGEDPRALRAALLLDRVEVLDVFCARLALQARRLLAADPPDCAAAHAVLAAVQLLVVASNEAGATSEAGLAQLPSIAGLDSLRDRSSEAGTRRASTATLLPAVEEDARGTCGTDVAAPTAFLPAAETRAVQGAVPFFVRTPAPGDVVWVDGDAVAFGGGAGWAAVVALEGPRRLCVAAAAADSCQNGLVATVTALAAFDLSLR